MIKDHLFRLKRDHAFCILRFLSCLFILFDVKGVCTSQALQVETDLLSYPPLNLNVKERQKNDFHQADQYLFLEVGCVTLRDTIARLLPACMSLWEMSLTNNHWSRSQLLTLVSEHAQMYSSSQWGGALNLINIRWLSVVGMFILMSGR